MSQTNQITSQPPEYDKLYFCQPGTPPTEETCELPNENGEPDGDGVIRAEPQSFPTTSSHQPISQCSCLGWESPVAETGIFSSRYFGGSALVEGSGGRRPGRGKFDAGLTKPQQNLWGALELVRVSPHWGQMSRLYTPVSFIHQEWALQEGHDHGQESSLKLRQNPKEASYALYKNFARKSRILQLRFREAGKTLQIKMDNPESTKGGKKTY